MSARSGDRVREDARAGVRWHSLHVHHHDAAAEPALILDAVRPAFDAVRPWTKAAWFGRHWLRGPHLRLNFLAETGDWENRVRPGVTAVVADHLRAHPSTALLDETALAPAHARLAELEMETGTRHPWVADNCVREQPYDHRLPVLGSLTASELLAGFLSDTNGLAFAAYAHMRTGEDALPVLALDLMWATVAAASIPFDADGDPIERGFLSLRSHADAFLSRTSDPGGYRRAFDTRFLRQREALSERLRAVERTLSEGGAGTDGDVPFVAEWARTVRRHQRLAHPLMAAGEVSMDAAKAAPRMPTRQVSEFHELLRSDHGHTGFLREDHWFASFRLVMNYLYVHLGRLGLTPVDRGLLCHLASHTVEAVHGVGAVDSFRRYVVAGPGSGGADGGGEGGEGGGEDRDGRPEWARLGTEWADGQA